MKIENIDIKRIREEHKRFCLKDFFEREIFHTAGCYLITNQQILHTETFEKDDHFLTFEKLYQVVYPDFSSFPIRSFWQKSALRYPAIFVQLCKNTTTIIGIPKRVTRKQVFSLAIFLKEASKYEIEYAIYPKDKNLNGKDILRYACRCTFKTHPKKERILGKKISDQKRI